MKIKRVSIFMPRDTVWYQGLALQISRAFQSFGIDVKFNCGHLNEMELSSWIRMYKPQVIFEMNRSRSDVPFLPKDIIHICWVVDFNGRHLSDFCGSEIVYLFGPKWVEKYDSEGFFRWFGPGACDIDYFPSYKNSCFKYKVSFIGHIPRPWSFDELKRKVSVNLTFGDILPYVEDAYKVKKDELKVHVDYISVINSVSNNIFGQSIIFNRTLEYDLTGRLIRLLNRKELIDAVLKKQRGIAIYGPVNWSLWPEYSQYYKFFLSKPSQMREVFNTTVINLHEGNGMHFRVMDGMMSGALMFVRKTEYDEHVGGIKHYFEPGRHYVEFDLYDLHEKIEFYFNNERKANDIRYNAFCEMKNNHTWRIRVKGILDDIKKL